VRVVPVSREALVDEVVALVLERPGRVRVALDGPSPTRPGALAEGAAERLRAAGRAGVVVDADDFLRPASVRLELGREDPDELLDRWLDEAALRREVLDRTDRVLPRLWNARTDRAHRAAYVDLPDDGVVLVHGALLLGRGLPFDAAVHLRMGAAARARTLPAWQLPAYERYERERDPGSVADLLVLSDHPDRPAVRR
jgi:hypothetical protein